MILAPVVRGLETRNPLVAPSFILAGKPVLDTRGEIVERAVDVAAHARHLDVLSGKTHAKQGKLAFVCYVWKDDIAVAQESVFVQVFLQLTERFDLVKAFGLGGL